MDNAQVMAKDGSWFLFGDWQGLTRISFPGDRVKTDANLDRPNEDRPLVERPGGVVWSAFAIDVDPVTLKKVEQEPSGHHSPDPLGGPEIVVDYAGAVVSIRGVKLALEARGEEIRLGGTPARRAGYVGGRYDFYSDDSLVVFGSASAGDGASGSRPQVALVTREPDGAGRVAWCRPMARLQNGSPDAFRDAGKTWLADRDIVEDVAYLVEVADGGEVVSEARAPAVAGPWVHDGQVWWQSDDATLCAGARLGEVARSFTLAPEHAGPGRLLRVPGRVLFVAWHRGTILDLAPVKRGKVELSRKHKAAEAPMYLEAERALRPIRAAMARRDVRVEWRGCVRRGKRLQPAAEITGDSDLVTYIVAYALRDGVAKRLQSLGVSWIDCMGGSTYDQIFAQEVPTSEQDLRDLMAMLDAAGIPGAASLGHVASLRSTAAQRGASLRLTPEAELLLASLTGGEASDPAVEPVVAQVAAPPAPRVLSPEEATICGELEGVLARDFGVDPAESRDEVGWYRFRIDGFAFQAGLHDDVRVYATLCRTETDVDLDKLMTSIGAANARLTGARFDEADCYIHVRAACSREDASGAQIKAMIEACRAAIQSKAGTSLRVKYEPLD